MCFEKKRTPFFFHFFPLLTSCRACSFCPLFHHAHICLQWKPRTLPRSGAHVETLVRKRRYTQTPSGEDSLGKVWEEKEKSLAECGSPGENPSCQTKFVSSEKHISPLVHTQELTKRRTLYHLPLTFEPSASTFIPSRRHFSPLVSTLSAFFCPLLSASPLLFAAHMANILSLWHHSLPALLFFFCLRFFFQDLPFLVAFSLFLLGNPFMHIYDFTYVKENVHKHSLGYLTVMLKST